MLLHIEYFRTRMKRRRRPAGATGAPDGDTWATRAEISVWRRRLEPAARSWICGGTCAHPSLSLQLLSPWDTGPQLHDFAQFRQRANCGWLPSLRSSGGSRPRLPVLEACGYCQAPRAHLASRKLAHSTGAPGAQVCQAAPRTGVSGLGQPECREEHTCVLGTAQGLWHREQRKAPPSTHPLA